MNNSLVRFKYSNGYLHLSTYSNEVAENDLIMVLIVNKTGKSNEAPHIIIRNISVCWHFAMYFGIYK